MVFEVLIMLAFLSIMILVIIGAVFIVKDGKKYTKRSNSTKNKQLN